MIKGGTKNFEYFYFYLGSYSCVRRLEVIVGKNIKQQTCKPVVCMFYLKTHRFLSGVQSPACTAYGMSAGKHHDQHDQLQKSGIKKSQNLVWAYEAFRLVL